MTGSITKGCPMCGKPAVQRFKPFCSARCADADLGAWLTEGYRVPGEEMLPLAGAAPTGHTDDDESA